MPEELIVFHPLFKDRVWGGRSLEERYRKELPPNVPIGESWELADRADAQSVVASGPFQGRSLHELWTTETEQIFGATAPSTPRFPLLVKILDARETLSVQVHPPAHAAAQLGGEPKTEVWYMLDTDPGSLIYAGLAEGATRESFAASIASGDVERQLHSFHAEPGDCVFVPSGRVHAIGGGNLILEVQQNSDTTYRVFDWNRQGLDGKPRALHIEQSMASIHFDDITPEVQKPSGNELVRCDEFILSKLPINGEAVLSEAGRFTILFCADGEVHCGETTLKPGQLALAPASTEPLMGRSTGTSALLLSARLP